MNADSIKIMSFLTYLLPVSLLTGPFLPDFLLVIVSLIFLFHAYSKNHFYYFKSKFFLIFLFFYIYIVFNSLFSEFSNFSLKSSLIYIRYGIFTLAIWFLLDNKKNFKEYFFYSILFAFSLALIDGYFQYIFKISIFGYDAATHNRLNILYSNGWQLGSYLVRLFPLALALAFYNLKPNKINSILIILSWILIDVLIYLSGERSAIVLMILSNLFIILLLKNFRVIRFFSFIIAIFTILMVTVYDSGVKSRNIDLTWNQIGMNQGNFNYFSYIHNGFVITGLNMFKDNPLFGIGVNNYRKLCNKKEYSYVNPMSTSAYVYEPCNTHPHNSYVQLLAETGIIGIAFILFFGIYFFKLISIHIYYKIRNKIDLYIYSDYQICLVACFLITLWPIVPTMNFFNNWISILYFLPIGFYLNSIYSKKNINNI